MRVLLKNLALQATLILANFYLMYFLQNCCQEIVTLYNQDQTSVILCGITEYRIVRFVQLGLLSPGLQFCDLLERGCTKCFCQDLRDTKVLSFLLNQLIGDILEPDMNLHIFRSGCKLSPGNNKLRRRMFINQYQRLRSMTYKLG
jgi:hypothetical protein